MGLFSRKQQSGGMIGYFGLSDWWLSTFTDSQRRQLDTLYAEAPVLGMSGPRHLATGPGLATTRRASQLVGELAVLADKPAPDLVPALLAKEEELALSSGNVLDLHFAYSTAIKLWYKRRDTQAGAFDAAVTTCDRQIAIAPQAWAAFAVEAEEAARKSSEFTGRPQAPVFQPPSHRGFQQLAIIREKQGDYAEALRLCREASSQGWRDGKGDWSKRIARMERRAAKK